MPILHDYTCGNCRREFEALVNPEQREVPCPICHVGTAVRIYRAFGGMLGKSKGKFPYFDHQLGITLESPQHRDRVAKERGLLVMGNDEFKRSRNAPSTPDPLDDPNPDPKLVEIAKRVWDDHKYGRIKPQAPQRADTNADFLDLSEAPKVLKGEK